MMYYVFTTDFPLFFFLNWLWHPSPSVSQACNRNALLGQHLRVLHFHSCCFRLTQNRAKHPETCLWLTPCCRALHLTVAVPAWNVPPSSLKNPLTAGRAPSSRPQPGHSDSPLYPSTSTRNQCLHGGTGRVLWSARSGFPAFNLTCVV